MVNNDKSGSWGRHSPESVDNNSQDGILFSGDQGIDNSMSSGEDNSSSFKIRHSVTEGTQVDFSPVDNSNLAPSANS